MSSEPFITEFPASMDLTLVIDGEPAGRVQRFGLWEHDGRKYQVTETSDNLPALMAKHAVPQERVFQLPTAAP